MKCEELKSKLADFLSGELDSPDQEACNLHLASCATCAEEVRLLSETWTRLGVLPLEQPSPALRKRFYGMLEDYQRGLVRQTGRKPFSRLSAALAAGFWPRRPLVQFGLAVALLMVGLGVGLLVRNGGVGSRETVQVQKNTLSQEQARAVSLLQRDSASERLQGINLIRDAGQRGETTLNALLDALNTDPNVNVRLAAAEALYLFGDDPQVKDRIILSLERQDSPLVQSALIDLLVGLREQRAVEALRQLIQDQKLNPYVKKKAAAGIQQLIY